MTKARSLSDFIESDGSVTLVDNQKIKLGTGNDLEIYHDGHSNIVDTGTGNLRIFGNSQIFFGRSVGGEAYATFNSDSSVNLYYNNSVKFQTASDGIDISGASSTTFGLNIIDPTATTYGAHFSFDDANGKVLIGGVTDGTKNAAISITRDSTQVDFGTHITLPDNGRIKLGQASDLQIYHDGNDSYVKDGGTGNLRIISNGAGVEINKNTTEYMIRALTDGAVELYHDSSKKIETSSSGVSVTGDIAVTGTVDGRDIATDGTKLDTIDTNANYITNNNQLTNGAGYVTSSGNTIIGTDSDIDTSGATVVDQLNMTDGVIQSHSTRTMTLADLGYTGATNANYITNNNQLTNGAGFTTYTSNQSLNTTDSPTFSTVYVSNWFRATGQSGLYFQSYGGGWQMLDSTWIRNYGSKPLYMNAQIACTSNITAYYSDERLKDKQGKIENALDKVSQIETFYFKENELAKELGHSNDKKQVGVSAQSVKKVLPEIVDLAPFDMDTKEDGEIVSMSGEDYMTIDYAKLTPLLIEAIKELKAEIKELKESK
jgi:hypothetical protein